MQEIRKSFDITLPDPDILSGTDLDRALFFDIETTGLSRERTTLYLIGAGFFKDGSFNTIQWFADKPSEENFILDDFLSFSEGYETLIHYNGNHFDLPYIDYKARLHSYENSLRSLKSIDIYPMIKPLKKLLGLKSIKLRDIAAFLHIFPKDCMSGRDLIHVYYDQVREPTDENLSLMLTHNQSDLWLMPMVLPILKYTALKDASFDLKDIKKCEYRDYHGDTCHELIIHYSTDILLPYSFDSLNDGIFFSYGDTGIAIRIPIKEMTLKHFFENYRDYYYLPADDMCIHKAVASGVDRSKRVRAKKDNCYIKNTGLYIPVFELDPCGSVFKKELRSDMNYAIYDDSLLENKEMQDMLCPALIKYLIKE
ncbi:MAG: ribonuclease H-like domain-containing protein [Lachnospiraceae bacterium]|nr:ribonuclease H-like domain-containing protein [Lachnospiraceae bacterium]